MSPGLPAGSAVPVPEGGLACFVACRPCRLFAVFPPSPRPPSRREGGVSKFILPGASPPAPLRPGGKRRWLFLWKAVPEGASPLASPGLNPGGTGFSFGKRCPRGACPRGCRLALLCRCPRGACLLCRLPTLPFVCFFAPIPPTPLPGGKGEFQSLFCRGLRPRHPCDRVGSGTGFSFGRRCPRGASPLASPALNRLRHLQTLPFRYPGASLPWNRV